MQLSSEQFERILSALRSDSPVSSTKDKRRKPRVGLRASVVVVESSARGKGKLIPAMVRDISREGIGLQRAVGMKAGQRFLIQLPNNDGEPQSILCTVRHCETVADAMYHIGATFIRVCNVNPKNDAQIVNADAAEAIAIQGAASVDPMPVDRDPSRIRKAILS